MYGFGLLIKETKIKMKKEKLKKKTICISSFSKLILLVYVDRPVLNGESATQGQHTLKILFLCTFLNLNKHILTQS